MKGDKLGVASPWAVHSYEELGLPESTPLPCLGHSILEKGHPSLALCLLVAGCPAGHLAGATTVTGRKRSCAGCSGTFLMSGLCLSFCP